MAVRTQTDKIGQVVISLIVVYVVHMHYGGRTVCAPGAGVRFPPNDVVYVLAWVLWVQGRVAIVAVVIQCCVTIESVIPTAAVRYGIALV